MQIKFIELTSFGVSRCGRSHHINPIMICSIEDCGSFSNVYTIGGNVIEVEENPEQIKKLIEDSEKWTLITK